MYVSFVLFGLLGQISVFDLFFSVFVAEFSEDLFLGLAFGLDFGSLSSYHLISLLKCLDILFVVRIHRILLITNLFLIIHIEKQFIKARLYIVIQ